MDSASASAASLSGAVIVITGGGSGIGRATATRLASLGAVTALVGRRAEALEETASMVRDHGGSALVLPTDLADRAAPEAIVAATVDALGRLDGVVNNAAIVRHRPLAEWSIDDFDRHVAVNVRAPYFLIQQALPALRSSPVRAVVNVSSSSGTLKRVPQSVYGMTKAALDYLTSSLAGEYAGEGIRINAVAPGPVDTPIHSTWSNDLQQTHRWLRGQVPLGRIATADELAQWIVLLLSPVASFVTGAVIPVDGGQVIDRD